MQNVRFSLRCAQLVALTLTSYCKSDDGYRLTYGGLDYLALNAHRRCQAIFSLGNQVGVGKESDIYVTASSSNRTQILKLHRLGRISFRSVKSNRDYLRNRSTGSWMYLSRLAAQKEWEVMRVLHREGFPVPEPIAWSRHTVVMEFIDAFPLRMVESVPEAGKLYAELMEMIVALARRGLIHGDFNEFNILIKEEQTGGKVKAVPVLIDFPQIVSTNHANAQMYFDRDVACVKRYFERRFKYVADEDGPFFVDAVKGIEKDQRLDIEIEASGFSKKMARDLERVVGFDANAEDKQADGGDVEEDLEVEEESDGDIDEDDEAQDEQGDERLEDDMRRLELGDDYAVKPVRASDFGLMPLELPQDPDVIAEKIHSKKKAGGWAI